jgi:hypothetical protein
MSLQCVISDVSCLFLADNPTNSGYKYDVFRMDVRQIQETSHFYRTPDRLDPTRVVLDRFREFRVVEVFWCVL